MIIVADTTPLSELAKVGRINLLQAIFGKVIIPQEVYNEVTTGNQEPRTVLQVTCRRLVERDYVIEQPPPG